MAPALDQFLFPHRLITRALDDLHRVAEAAGSLGILAHDMRSTLEPLNRWMKDTATSLRSLREDAAGVRAAIESMGQT